MRQETRKIATAFIERRKATAARTSTDGDRLGLHGHTIAWWDNDSPSVLYVTFCSYPTTTTKDRLNGVFELLGLGRPFYTKDHQLYFGCELRPVDPRETIRIDIELARRCRADNQPIAA